MRPGLASAIQFVNDPAWAEPPTWIGLRGTHSFMRRWPSGTRRLRTSRAPRLGWLVHRQ